MYRFLPTAALISHATSLGLLYSVFVIVLVPYVISQNRLFTINTTALLQPLRMRDRPGSCYSIECIAPFR